jgi:predicted Zn-dependent protease
MGGASVQAAQSLRSCRMASKPRKRANPSVDRRPLQPYFPWMPWNRRLIAVALVLAGLSTLGGCASTRRSIRDRGRTGPIVTDAEERILGARLDAQIRTEGALQGDLLVARYVQALGDRLARLSDRPEIPYSFAVLKSSEALAFASPGGYVYVTTGLLRRLDAQCQLAAILAHEMAHIALRDPVRHLADELGREGVTAIVQSERTQRPIAETVRGAQALRGSYPGQVEDEVDRMAMLGVSRIGLDAHGLIEVLEKADSTTTSTGIRWEGDPVKPKRLSGLRADFQSMGLAAGLSRDSDPYARIRARLR